MLKKIIFPLLLATSVSTASASIITFDFTGGLVLAGIQDTPVPEREGADGSFVRPISATLIYDTEGGIGSSNLSITTGIPVQGARPIFHDITMERTSDNIITGNVLVDHGFYSNMSMHVEWDATGFFSAIDYGLQEGHVLSGSTLYDDVNGNGVFDDGVDTVLKDIGSATPYSDELRLLNGDTSALQGSAPLAATSGSLGLIDGPFPGVKGYFDIGSGNSMHVTNVSAVPVPAAVWLFGSGLVGLVGFARRRKSA